MSHTQRAHVVGGVHYVVMRGNGNNVILKGKDDHTRFEELLARTLKPCNASVYAYCWTAIEFRMIIGVQKVALARVIQRVASRYALYFNQQHAQCGRVFAEGYHSTLLLAADQQLTALRAVHYAPVMLGMAPGINDHDRSSHFAYRGDACVPWLTTDRLLTALEQEQGLQREAYDELMALGPPKADHMQMLASASSNGHHQGGNHKSDNSAVVELREAAAPVRKQATLSQILLAVSQKLDTQPDYVLSKSRARTLTLARALVRWHAVRNGIASAQEVADWIDRDSSTLYAGQERYRLLKPDLFDCTLDELLGEGKPKNPEREKRKIDSAFLQWATSKVPKQ